MVIDFVGFEEIKNKGLRLLAYDVEKLEDAKWKALEYARFVKEVRESPDDESEAITKKTN